MVEFALALPVILSVMFGAVEFGTALYDKAVLTNASREGARFGMVATSPRKTDAQINTVVQTYAASNMINYKQSNAVTTDGNPVAGVGADAGDTSHVCHDLQRDGDRHVLVHVLPATQVSHEFYRAAHPARGHVDEDGIAGRLPGEGAMTDTGRAGSRRQPRGQALVTWRSPSSR